MKYSVVVVVIVAALCSMVSGSNGCKEGTTVWIFKDDKCLHAIDTYTKNITAEEAGSSKCLSYGTDGTSSYKIKCDDTNFYKIIWAGNDKCSGENHFTSKLKWDECNIFGD